MSAIIEKIRKLLRKGAGNGNANEAQVAIAMAFELARKHSVDLDSIDLSDDEAIERLLIRIGSRCSTERKLILGVLKTFFRVHVVLTFPDVALIGRVTDVAIAHYAHDFLLNSLRLALREFQNNHSRKLSKTKKQSFAQGWIYGVCQQLRACEQQLVVEDSRMALVPTSQDPRIMAASASYYPDTMIVPAPQIRKNREALTEGFLKGEKVNVRTPLAGPEPKALPSRSRGKDKSGESGQMDLF